MKWQLLFRSRHQHHLQRPRNLFRIGNSGGKCILEIDIEHPVLYNSDIIYGVVYGCTGGSKRAHIQVILYDKWL